MSSILIYSLFFVIGCIFGSFIMSLVWRIYTKQFSCTARSVCTKCAIGISWYHNIPIMSFLLLRGACNTCKKPISSYYIMTEIVAGLLLVFLAFFHDVSHTGVTLLFVRDAIILLLLLFIFIYDARYMQIITGATIIPASVLFLVSLYFGWHTWQSMVLAALVGGGFFLIQYLISKGKWIGGGDIRLGVFMGVTLGWPNILCALFLAYISGALIGVLCIIFRKKQLASEIAFGTYLAVATAITLFWGEQIIQWYISLL